MKLVLDVHFNNMAWSTLPLLLLIIIATNQAVSNAESRKRHQPETPSDYLMEQAMMDNLLDTMTMEIENPIIPDSLMVPDKDIGFYLFTRENLNNPVILDVNDIDSLRRANFNRSAPTKVIIHGWTDTGGSSWMHDFKRNYLKTGNYNVIIVDWSLGSLKEYLIATRFAKQVGDLASQLLEYLIIEGIVTPGNIHILGHSLGAHIAGFIGSNLAGRVARITGMDPARPDFETPLVHDPKERLDPSDAKFVDVIHTCAGTAGFVRPLGHVDFYPNGGSFRQPGCPVLLTQFCSHARSHQFMSESIINPLSFPALECSGWREFKMNRCDKTKNHIVFMGENLESKARGVYFLETNAASPFGKGKLVTQFNKRISKIVSSTETFFLSALFSLL